MVSRTANRFLFTDCRRHAYFERRFLLRCSADKVGVSTAAIGVTLPSSVDSRTDPVIRCLLLSVVHVANGNDIRGQVSVTTMGGHPSLALTPFGGSARPELGAGRFSLIPWMPMAPQGFDAEMVKACPQEVKIPGIATVAAPAKPRIFLGNRGEAPIPCSLPRFSHYGSLSVKSNAIKAASRLPTLNRTTEATT